MPKANLLGHMGKPKKCTLSILGHSVLKFSIATSKKFKSKCKGNKRIQEMSTSKLWDLKPSALVNKDFYLISAI